MGPASEPQALPASKNSSLSFKISKIKSFFSIAASSHGQIWFSLSRPLEKNIVNYFLGSIIVMLRGVTDLA